MSGYEAMIREVRFAEDSPLEGDGFEPSVPHKRDRTKRRECQIFRKRIGAQA
jgi:hypothetical protein